MGLTNIMVIVSLLSFAYVSAQFSNTNSVRVCIQSANEVQLRSQCVVCLRESYNFLMSLCCRVPYLPQNVTIEQGSCIVQACQQQKLDNSQQSGITGFFSNLFNSLFNNSLFNSIRRGRRDTPITTQLTDFRNNIRKRNVNKARVVPKTDNVKNYYETFYAKASQSSIPFDKK